MRGDLGRRLRGLEGQGRIVDHELPGADDAAPDEQDADARGHEHSHFAPHPVGLRLGEERPLPSQIDQRVVDRVDAQLLTGVEPVHPPYLRHLADRVAVGLEHDVSASLHSAAAGPDREHRVLVPRLRADQQARHRKAFAVARCHRFLFVAQNCPAQIFAATGSPQTVLRPMAQ